MITYVWPDSGATPGTTMVRPSFSSAAELKAALLACFVPSEIAFFGRPVIAIPQGRDFDLRPAWGWTKFLIETRSDWWPALGVAIQHVAKENEAHARLALDDMITNDYGDAPYALAIMEWLAPLAEGKNDDLAKHIAELEVKWDKAEEKGLAVEIEAGKPIAIANEADLEQVLREAPKSGWTEIWNDNWYPEPWGLGLSMYARTHRWLAEALPRVCAKILTDDASERTIWAALTFFANERFDLWRHRAIFDAWTKPSWRWAGNAAEVASPKGPYKPESWKPHPTLGDIALALKILADEQAQTPVVMNLA